MYNSTMMIPARSMEQDTCSALTHMYAHIHIQKKITESTKIQMNFKEG